MPAKSTVFYNLKGGSGKSTLLFHAACQYAQVGAGDGPAWPAAPAAAGCRSTTACSTLHRPIAHCCAPVNLATQTHPEEKVLVLDCTAFGDVSNLFLGGCDPLVDDEREELLREGKAASKLMEALVGGAALAPAAPAGPVTPGKMPFYKIYEAVTRRQSAGEAKSKPAAQLDNIAERFGVRLPHRNPEIKLSNLYFIPSGATKRQPCVGLQVTNIK